MPTIHMNLLMYPVIGRTGEYDDACHWTAGVAYTEQAAHAECERLNRILRLRGWYMPEVPVTRTEQEFKVRYNAMRLDYDDVKAELGDPHFHMDHTGTAYEVGLPIPVVGE